MDGASSRKVCIGPVSWVRGEHQRGVHTPLNASIEAGRLRLHSYALLCHSTGAGCTLRFEEPVPEQACIRYAFGSWSTIVVAIDRGAFFTSTRANA
jgi:hypothetical protein